MNNSRLFVVTGPPQPEYVYNGHERGIVAFTHDVELVRAKTHQAAKWFLCRYAQWDSHGEHPLKGCSAVLYEEELHGPVKDWARIIGADFV